MTQPKIVCPHCGEFINAQVIDSRPNRVGVYRRRRCEACGGRFTTQETIASQTTPGPKNPRTHNL